MKEVCSWLIAPIFSISHHIVRPYVVIIKDVHLQQKISVLISQAYFTEVESFVRDQLIYILLVPEYRQPIIGVRKVGKWLLCLIEPWLFDFSLPRCVLVLIFLLTPLSLNIVASHFLS